MTAGAPSFDLSVIVATAHPSPDYDRLLEALLPQLAEVGGELVLADGSAHGVPTPAYRGVAVTHLRDAGADIFALRARATPHARGWVVAYTEDHCLPEPGWCRNILTAHRRHGDRAAVSGAATNGTVDTLWDRASFLLTFAPVLPPLPAGPLQRVPPPANVSIKREALEPYGELGDGFLEFELMPHLHRAGHVALADDVRVSHYQGKTRNWFVIHHFHNGRTTTGLLDRAGGLRQFARRARDSIALVPRHTLVTFREVWRRPAQRRPDLPAVPFVGVLLAAHATGQLVGLLAGPGDSPAELD